MLGMNTKNNILATSPYVCVCVGDIYIQNVGTFENTSVGKRSICVRYVAKTNNISPPHKTTIPLHTIISLLKKNCEIFNI